MARSDHEPGALCLASRHRQAILLGSEHPSPLSLDSQQTDHRNARYCSIEECILSPLALVNELLCYSTTPIQILLGMDIGFELGVVFAGFAYYFLRPVELAQNRR